MESGDWHAKVQMLQTGISKKVIPAIAFYVTCSIVVHVIPGLNDTKTSSKEVCLVFLRARRQKQAIPMVIVSSTKANVWEHKWAAKDSKAWLCTWDLLHSHLPERRRLPDCLLTVCSHGVCIVEAVDYLTFIVLQIFAIGMRFSRTNLDVQLVWFMCVCFWPWTSNSEVFKTTHWVQRRPKFICAACSFLNQA